MNPIANLIASFAIILDLFLLIFIILNSKKTKATYFFMASIISLALWSSIELGFLLNLFTDNAHLFYKILKSDAFIFSTVFLPFVIYFTESKFRWPAWIVVSLNLLFALITLSSDLVISGVTQTVQLVKGPLYFVAPLLMSSSMIVALAYLIITYKKTDDQRLKHITKFILLSYLVPFFFGIPMGITTMLDMQTFLQVLPMASIYATLLFSFITYALLRYDF